MRRVYGLDELGEPPARSVVTIGKFFAVHRGHQALLQATVRAARRHTATSVALTFDRHPAEILKPGTGMPILASLDERLDLMEEQGLDMAVVIRLNHAFLAQEAEEFVRETLAGRLHAHEVLASDNFRFGRGARGDLNTLRSLGEQYGFELAPVEPLLDGGERISSSRIAACIEEGRAAEAARLLGRPYSLPGLVVRGDQIGRQLGFPTANVRTEPNRLMPKDGVYTVRLDWEKESRQGGRAGVANLGVRPTRDGLNRILEVHLLDWEGDLYDRSVEVRFLDRLRDEQRFPDVTTLRAQIARDVEAARLRFAELTGS